MKKGPTVVDYDPYSSLGKHGFSFIDDDFISKLGILKIKSKNQSNTNLAFKFTLDSSKENYNITEDLKLWYVPAWNDCGWAYVRLKNNYMKYHYESNYKKILQNKIKDTQIQHNYGFSFQSSRNFKEWSIRSAFNLHVFNSSKYDNQMSLRLKLSSQKIILNYRMNLAKNNFRAALYGASDIYNKCLLNKGFLLGYKNQNYQAYIRTQDKWNSCIKEKQIQQQCKGFQASWFGKITTTILFTPRQLNKAKLGVQGTYDLQDRQTDFCIAGKLQLHKDNFIKSKLYKSLKYNTVYKLQYDNKNIGITLGANGNLRQIYQSKIAVQFDLSL